MLKEKSYYLKDAIGLLRLKFFSRNFNADDNMYSLNL